MFRILTAFQGTSFFVIGSSSIGDIYRPVERSTALGWFLSGSLIGPTIGPVLGGILTEYRGWRTIFWLQTALAALATILLVLLFPETSHHKKFTDIKKLGPAEKTKTFLRQLSPHRVVTLFRLPNLLVAAVAASCLLWNMYSLLVS